MGEVKVRKENCLFKGPIHGLQVGKKMAANYQNIAMVAIRNPGHISNEEKAEIHISWWKSWEGSENPKKDGENSKKAEIILVRYWKY